MRVYSSWFPITALKDSDRVFPERTLFVNSKCSWADINTITENSCKGKGWSSNHFLHAFIHEFCHVAHQGHLHKRFDYFELENILKKLKAEEYICEYKRRFRKILSKLSARATKDPFEAMAEYMTREISKSLNQELNPTYNPFTHKRVILSAISLLKQTYKDEKIMERILERAWNGEDLFDVA